MTFLTSWRMAPRPISCRERGTTVAQVAQQVGYGSPFTFSTAFKRSYGLSPKAYRERAPPPRRGLRSAIVLYFFVFFFFFFSFLLALRWMRSYSSR